VKYLTHPSIDWVAAAHKSKQGPKYFQRFTDAASDRFVPSSHTNLYLSISGVKRLRKGLAEVCTNYLDGIPLPDRDDADELLLMTSFESQTQNFRNIQAALLATEGFRRITTEGALESDPVIEELVQKLSMISILGILKAPRHSLSYRFCEKTTPVIFSSNTSNCSIRRMTGTL
jgi:hypothetical protein